MSIKIERICDVKSILGESPFWDESTQSVYYVDIFGKTVNRYTPATEKHVSAVVGDKNVAFIIPVEGEESKFLVGYGNEIIKLAWDGVSDKIGGYETIVELKNTPEKKHRFNDAKVSPSGRLWAGVFIPKDGGGFVPNAGGLYELNPDKTLTELTSGITLSNGLAWNEKINKFYYVDTAPGEVYQYDYKPGQISNRQVICKLSETGVEGGPDGLTIDNEGHLWISTFGGSKIIKIYPNEQRTILQTIDMPVKQVTCAEFGGPNYEELYVTTAAVPAGPDAPLGGWTYKVTGLGVRGLPARKVKL